MQRRVEVIPAKDFSFGIPKEEKVKRKVAAYARVSTDSDEQLTSYDMQVRYYTEHIKSNPDWTFVKVYTDEGISGLMTKDRLGFQSMIKDALVGKIDLIITKSVSRFARNTVDTLTYVRTLKEKGVEVYFEKENIYTLDSKGELMITIMSSLAQEESRSISENVAWGKRKQFAEGKVSMPYGGFLGYKKGEDGTPEVVPEEANIVRRIYKDFLYGMSYSAIAKSLTEDKILTPRGKSVWSESTVRSILNNEKYKGDALLQKSYVSDFLTKKSKKNRGELPQYYVENSHEAIISDEVFDMAQIEIRRRKKKKGNGSSVNIFSSKLICSSCGNFLTRKVWHSTSQYRRYIWQCGHKYKGEEKCKTPHLYEDDIKEAFMLWVNELLLNLPELRETTEKFISEILDTSTLEKELQEKEEQAKVLYDRLKVLMQKNSKEKTDVFKTIFEEQLKEYELLNEDIKALREKIEDMKYRNFQCKITLQKLDSIENPILEFNDKLWIALVDCVTVSEDGSLEFKLK